MKLTKNLLDILRCPNCGDNTASLEVEDDHLLCPACSAVFPVVTNRPVMLKRDNAVFQIDKYQEGGRKRFKRPGGWISRLIPDPSINLSRTRVLECLKTLLKKRNQPGY